MWYQLSEEYIFYIAILYMYTSIFEMKQIQQFHNAHNSKLLHVLVLTG